MNVPIEIVVEILNYCDAITFIKFGKTCSRYRSLLSNNELWNQMCRNDFRQNRSVILYGSFSYLALYNSAKILRDNKDYNIPLFRQYKDSFVQPNRTPMEICKQEFRKHSRQIKRQKTSFHLLM